jgi:hypothetical protein
MENSYGIVPTSAVLMAFLPVKPTNQRHPTQA